MIQRLEDLNKWRGRCIGTKYQRERKKKDVYLSPERILARKSFRKICY